METDNAMQSTFHSLTPMDVSRMNGAETIFLEESECIPLFEGESKQGMTNLMKS